MRHAPEDVDEGRRLVAAEPVLFQGLLDGLNLVPLQQLVVVRVEQSEDEVGELPLVQGAHDAARQQELREGQAPLVVQVRPVEDDGVQQSS